LFAANNLVPDLDKQI